MILYFSATGNTRYVANLIAKELGDETIDMLPLIKKDKACQIRSDRPFIICVPSYICDVPVFIAQFLKKVTLQGNDLVYTVFTCGHSSGIASNTVKEIVECQGKKFAGSYDVSMPNNYIVVDMFKGTPDDEIAFRLKDAEFSAKRIALAVKSKRILKSKKVSLIKKQAIKAVVNGYVKYKQSAKPFHVDNDKCGSTRNIESDANDIIITDTPAWIFDVLANLPMTVLSGKKDIVKFSKWTLTHDLVGDTIVGEKSFKEYIKDYFSKH